MKQILLSILRDKNTSRAQFRDATAKLAALLAEEASQYLTKEKFVVETPLGPAQGTRFQNSIVLVPILRAGLALLYPFMHFFPDARVGFVGMRRDEVTAEPHQYYQNIPTILPEDQIIVLEPMIATGGSGTACLERLCRAGAKQEQILFVGIVAAPEGLNVIHYDFPRVRCFVASIDEGLNSRKFILPGLGDFGDRYFGTG